MSSTSISNLRAEVPQNVSKAVAAFGQGSFSLAEVREAIALALDSDATLAESIHELLDEELKARNLTIAHYGELIGAIGAVASENVPTECSDDAPEASGVYRVAEEGTLVPTDLSEWPEFQAVVAGDDESDYGQSDDVPPEAEAHTRPFDEPTAPEVAADGTSEASAGPNVDQGVDVSADASLPNAKNAMAAWPGTVLRDRFRLGEEVARGAMGVVFRATDLMKQDVGADDPQIAVKLVSPEVADDKNALRAFQNEFVNTQQLSHPSIVRVFELDRDGDQYFITMEWLEGQSLASLLDSSKGSALQPTQTYAIIEQLCDALIYAHEHNVVHADVKPGNVFLLDTGEVKLIDFGIARNESDVQASDDGDETVALTPAYASCERLEKQTPSPQDDLYSLASLVYRLIAGRRVFGPLTALDAESQSAECVRIGGMDDRRWSALSKALAFRREDRQPSVQAFSDEFGRRSHPRDEVVSAGDAGQQGADDVIEDTAQLPVLDTAPGSTLIDDIDLPADMEVDFPLDADAADSAHAPAPELAGVFDAAALSGDTEEIVLSSEPEPVPQPIEFPPPQADKPKLRPSLPFKLPAINFGPVRAAIAGTLRTKIVPGIVKQKKLVVVAAALIAVVVLGISWFGGEGENAPPRTVRMPERAIAPPPQPESTPTLAGQAAEPVGELEPGRSEPELGLQSQPEPDLESTPELQPEPQPEPVVAAVQPEVAAKVEAAPVADAVTESVAESEVVAEAEPQSVADTATATESVEIAVDTTEPDAPQNVAADLADEAAATDDLASETEFSETELVETELVEGESAENLAEAAAAAPREMATVPVPVAVPEPAPETVALSELNFIEYAEPRYPRSSSDRRYEGWVDVEFRLGADGFPTDIEVVDTNLPTKFKGRSIDAVEKWQFEPYLHLGEPIAVNSAVRLRFAN